MAKTEAAPPSKPQTAAKPADPNKGSTDAPKESRSVVPAKYAGKYKNGGEGATSEFIKSQCGEGDKFEFPAFFSLCRINGIPDDKVGLYEGQVAEKKNGANGRARMTLGNMLRAKARKDQKLLDLKKKEVAVAEPALPKAEKKAA